VRFVERRHFEPPPNARRVAAVPGDDEPLRVALLGTLEPHKGADVLLACAADARDRDLPLWFDVIGKADTRQELEAVGNVRVSGAYREGDVFDLLEAFGCHCALFLSVWPETYSYTLSIAQAAGLYCVAFDIGAPAARIAEWGWGEVLPLGTPPGRLNDRLLAVARRLRQGGTAPPMRVPSYPNLLRDYYGLEALGAEDGTADPPTIPLRSARAARGTAPRVRAA
jgi:glycosyltransferase involved in cell wall biosynthesis